MGSSFWEGYAFLLINKLFNLMNLYSGLCCKWHVCIIRINENSTTFMLYVKVGPTLECRWEWFSDFCGARRWVLHLSLLFYFEKILRIPAAALLICNYPPHSPVWFSTVGLEEVVQTTSVSSGYVCIIPDSCVSICILKYPGDRSPSLLRKFMQVLSCTYCFFPLTANLDVFFYNLIIP